MSVQVDPPVPSDDDARLAHEARSALQSSERLDSALQLQVATGGKRVTFELPPIVTNLLLEILEETAAGKAISLVPVEPEITTHQAAAILNVSRPYLIGLVDKGTLPARLVGKHRRLPLREVLAYRAEDFARRSKGLDEIVARDRELGLF